jgi:hypothetical protein
MGALVGACAQIIGLNDYDKTADNGGKGGGAGKGGAAGSGGSSAGRGGTSMEAGAGGSNGGSTSGRGGSGGSGGTQNTAGAGNEAGVGATAGESSGGSPAVGGTGGRGGTGGTGNTSAAGDGGSGPSYDCVSTREFEATLLSRDDTSGIYPQNNAFSIMATDGLPIGNAAQDELWVDFYAITPYTGEETGTFNLAHRPDDNYATCVHCVWIGSDFGTTSPPKTYYYVKSGTMTIDPSSKQMDGYPVLTIDDLTLVESTIDVGDTNVSEPVTNPRCLHIAHVDLDMPPPPADWTCYPQYYGMDDGCDCGCGAVDPDCYTQYSTACDPDACGESGSCVSDGYCAGLDPTNNAVCTDTPTWKCGLSTYGDGASCDCGCGIVDVDCTSAEASACDTCNSYNSCDIAGDCATINPTDNSQCL